MALLDSIDSPEDLKRLKATELKALAEEIRARIVAVVGRNGGHLSSNLGVVELTLAIHRVFDSPRDAIVWDVGHQCYAHKIITGRRDEFEGIRSLGGISGFPKRSESPHDAFDTGHASTSISAALGILAARRLLGQGGVAVAVIGDGALTGGMAFEALGHAGQLGLPLVIILNDNKMSISPNVGALSGYLSRLSATVRYQGIRSRIDRMVKGIPFVGSFLYALMYRGKRAVKALLFKQNLFSDLGFEYAGPIDGHSIPAMTQVLREARALGKPVVVHVVTRKGKGHNLAEEDPSRYHGVSPNRCVDADDVAAAPGAPDGDAPATFTEAFSRAMLRRGCFDERLVAVTAAMTTGMGLDAFKAACPGRLYDVGIAEEHAVTFAAGLASAGLQPVVALYSTFAQRAVDQIFHDVALPCLPVVIALDRSGAVGEDGETHQGLYDLALFRSFPNLAILAPASAVELALCLEWALDSGRPAIVRYPKAPCPREEEGYAEELVPGRGVFLRRAGAQTLIVALGALASQAVEASELLAAEAEELASLAERSAARADVYSLRFVSPFDEDFFLEACSPYARVLVFEEGVARGGFGEYLVSLIASRLPRVSAWASGFPSEPFAQASRPELLVRSGLDCAGIIARVRASDALEPRRSFAYKAALEGK